MTCDACNQYFGSKVEKFALTSFPFDITRLLLGVATKKGRFSSTEIIPGTLHGTGMPGIIEASPRDAEFAERFKSGAIKQFRILAEVTEPLATCRMLLKIGLELLGKHFYDEAVSDRFRDARMFARNPRRGQHWWSILRNDPAQLISAFSDPKSQVWEIELVELSGVLCSVTRFPGTDCLTPLEAGTSPPVEYQNQEPLFRIVKAQC